MSTKKTKPVAEEVAGVVEVAEVALAEEVAKPKSNLPTFTKAQLLASATYSHRRGVLGTLLADNKEYSHACVAEILEKFMKEGAK